MKIVLVNPPTRVFNSPKIVPLGILYIATILKRNHQVTVVDSNVESQERLN